MSAEQVLLQVTSLALTLIQAQQRYAAALTKIGALLTRVQAEGRPISEAEWQGLLADDDVARAKLQAEIARQIAGQ